MCVCVCVCVCLTSARLKPRTSLKYRGRERLMPSGLARKKKLVTTTDHTGADVKISDHGMAASVSLR